MHVVMNFIKENKKKILIILLFVFIVIILFVILNKKNEDKVYRTESYVFIKESYEHDNGLISELPYINIKGDEFREINTMLIKKYYEVTTVDDKIMTYILHKNDNILSLIVRINDKESPDSYPIEMFVYNIDYKLGMIINDNQMLQLFDISFEDVDKVIMQELKQYYAYEVENKYISSDCDFECYLSMTQSLPLDDCSYYVRNNTLFAYKSISLGSDFFYDTNSGFDLFNFKIKEK